MLERRKVYIEFTGQSSVLLVTPYVSKEYQLNPNNDFHEIDLVSLKWCHTKEDEEKDFYCRIECESTDKDSKPITPSYSLDVYVRDSENSFDNVGYVTIAPSENKQKFSVSFPSREQK